MEQPFLAEDYGHALRVACLEQVARHLAEKGGSAGPTQSMVADALGIKQSDVS